MYCLYCGKELPDDAKFCNNCGKELTNHTVNDISNTQPISTDFYVLILLTFGSHYGHCGKALSKQFKWDAKRARRVMDTLKANRNKGLILCVDKQKDALSRISRPFEDLNCQMKVLQIHEDQNAYPGEIVDLNTFPEGRAPRLPCCPMCGSTNLKKIGAGHTFMLMNRTPTKKSFHSFECLDCGYLI